jgi:peroxiredoxin
MPSPSQHVYAGAILAAVLTVAGCTLTSQAVSLASVKAVQDRKEAPSFQLKDADGKSVQLSDYKGKVVLLNFFATWCGPCKIEIPWFVEFEKTYRDKGFAVLGVAMDDEGWEIVKPFIGKRDINYRVLLGTDTVAQLYGGVDSLPTTFVVDREGRIASVHVGLISKGDYQNEITTLLGGSPRIAALSFGNFAFLSGGAK